MGLLTIQFGQCGNQIGHAIFKYIINDISETKKLSVTKVDNSEYINLTKDLWFSGYNNFHYIPRSVLVDTENKVVSSLINNNDSLKFNNIVAKSGGGSANNWAFGYTQKSENLINDVLESVRKEIEKSNDVTHIISFLSSGGGTGSGTGSRILESLRSEFPNKTIINVIVLPYKNGEVVTQNYNTLLTLAKLYDLTDGNIIFENDILHKICSSLLSVENVDLHHMNYVIAQKLSAVFQPAIDYSVYDFVSHLTSHPSYKFVGIKTTPHVAREHVKFESVRTWTSLVGHMRKELRANNQLREITTSLTAVRQKPVARYWKSVASLLISRGGPKPEHTVWEPLLDKELYPSWIDEVNKLKHFYQPRKLTDKERFLALATNNNSIVNTLEFIINQAWNLFQHKAYLHQYSKYGIEETEFETAFEKLESVLNNYKEL